MAVIVAPPLVMPTVVGGIPRFFGGGGGGLRSFEEWVDPEDAAEEDPK